MLAVPPGVRYRVGDVLALLPTDGGPLEGAPLDRLNRLLDDGEPWLGADPQLADVGAWMIQPRHSAELRRVGCAWLAMFPSPETARLLADVATDAHAPAPVREQAIRVLGDRSLRARHPSTLWSAEALHVADDALLKLADAATAAGKLTSEALPIALRHVHSDLLSALFARAPGLWGEAIECFATPPLARVLFVSLDDIQPQHRVRTLRLVALALGEESVPVLLARASQAAPDERLEILFLAVAMGGEPQLGRLEDAVKGMKFADLLRQRARWHLANKGVVPTVRGLRVARTTAMIPAAERTAKCAQAADDLGALTKFARHPEAYLYAMWGWMVRGANDPLRARDLVSAHPESQWLVRDLYFEDLAKRGRVRQLAATAQSLSGADRAALLLAIYGRPLAALELAATARAQTPELVCARALACYRAGRPDLTMRILDVDLPPGEVVADDELPKFPGPHENWLIENAPHARPAIAALARGAAAVIGLAKQAPDDAEPDVASLDAMGAVTRRLGRGLAGATIYLAGEFKMMHKKQIVAAIEKVGARLVSGPFPGTDYYIHGEWCAVQTVAQLERQGTRRLLAAELEKTGGGTS
jgi:hypothetical protein